MDIISIVGAFVHDFTLLMKVAMMIFLALWTKHLNQASQDFWFGVGFWLMAVFLASSITRHGSEEGNISGFIVIIGFILVVLRISRPQKKH